MSSTAAPLAPADEETILEQALHAQVLLRCRRALLHEIRNGLQPMRAGLEAISRVMSQSPFPVEKVQRYLQLLRQASTSQAIALEHAIERIAPERAGEQAVDLAALLREVTRFLNSDAAVAGVRLQLDTPATAFVRARPHQLQLIALCLTTHAIDRAGVDGRLSISIQALEDRVLLQFSDARASTDAAERAGSDEASDERFHLHVIGGLIAKMHGHIECVQTPGSGRLVAITLPMVDERSG